MASPSVESFSTGDEGNSTSQTVVMPGTVSADSLLIVIIGGRETSTFSSVPTGWTSFGKSSATNTHLEAFYKDDLADGTEDGATVEWNTSLQPHTVINRMVRIQKVF